MESENTIFQVLLAYFSIASNTPLGGAPWQRLTGTGQSVCQSFCDQMADWMRLGGPLWVKSGHHNPFKPCPLYPRKRTLIGALSVSDMGAR